MKRVLILLLFPLPACLMWLSCGSTPSSPGTSTVPYRAFITNSVAAGSLSPAVYIVNAETDVRAPVSPISAGNTPGMMVLTPNRAQTLVFSGSGTQSSDNQFTIINNAKQSAASHVILPGMTQSFVVSPDSSIAYVAVPTAQVNDQSPGAVEVIALSSGTITATISCPVANSASQACSWPSPVPQGFNQPYQFLSIGNTGNRILAFSGGADSVADVVAVITPSNVATSLPVITFVAGTGAASFDHPIWAYFNSDDSTAYVLNCGAECGGQQASIQTLDLTTTPPTPGITVPVPAATVALVSGSTMYLAGTPSSGGVPSQSCNGQTTAAPACGVLTIFDLNTMSVVQPLVQPPYCAAGQQCPIIITDGYHDHLALGADGQLFIGARTCTEIIPPLPPPTGAEVRGCLSIYNTQGVAVGNIQPSAVVIPPANGDVTGIQPLPTRGVSGNRHIASNAVYVIQGGSLAIYDATTDALEYNPNDPNNPGQIFGLIGQFIDVKTPDF